MPLPLQQISRLRLLLPAGVLLVLGCGNPGGDPPAKGNGETPTPTAEEIEGVSVDEVLQRLVEAYRGADSYFDNAEYHERNVFRNEGVPHEQPSHVVSVVFQRPNMLRVNRRVPAVRGGDLIVSLGCDGQRLRATHSDYENQILDAPAPESIGRETFSIDPKLKGGLLEVPLEYLYPQLDLLWATEASPPRLLAGAEPRLLASKDLAGMPCYRVRLEREVGAYIAWIDKSEHLLRRLEIPSDEVLRQLDRGNALLRLELWIDFHDAGFDTAISPQAFRIEPPEGAELVGSFSAPVEDPEEEASEEAPPESSEE